MTIRLTRFDRTTVLVIGALAAAAALTAVLIALQPDAGTTGGANRMSGAHIAYLSPTRGPYQIWSVDPADPASAQPLTEIPNGVLDFDVSADGRQIAFTTTETDLNGYQLYVLDVESRQPRLLLDCVSQDAYCTTPVWRPDGRMLAYQRVENNTALNLPPSAPRVWLLDLGVQPPTTYPLTNDREMLGSQPVWSGDGSRLAFYDANSQQVVVYSFAEPDETARLTGFPGGGGSVGALSPDGRQLIFPEYVISSPEPHLTFRVADLIGGSVRPLTQANEAANDHAVTWHPDGQHVVITRTYPDRRGNEVYRVDLPAGSVEPLIADEDYQQTTVRFSPDGSRIALDRYNLAEADATSTVEIWTYKFADDGLADGTLTQAAADGFLPKWMPPNAGMAGSAGMAGNGAGNP